MNMIRRNAPDIPTTGRLSPGERDVLQHLVDGGSVNRYPKFNDKMLIGRISCGGVVYAAQVLGYLQYRGLLDEDFHPTELGRRIKCSKRKVFVPKGHK